MSEQEIKEVYEEDTTGRKYRTPIMSKKGGTYKDIPAGEVSALKLGEPLSFLKFQKLSDTLKATYIKYLRAEYNVSSKQIAMMLGCNISYFSTSTISRLNLGDLFKVRVRQTEEQKSRWQEFVTKGQDKVKEEAPAPERTSALAADVTRCGFTMKGALKLADIARKVGVMIPEGTKCKITISIDRLEEEEE